MKNDKTSAPLRAGARARRQRAGEGLAPRSGGRRSPGAKSGRRAAHGDRSVRQPGRESLLEAATSLFAEHGYDAVTTRQILERAGVEAPSLYHHFDSKLGLYRAVLADTSEPFVQRFVRLGAKLRRDESASAQSVLDEMVWASFRGALSNPETVRIALFEATRPGTRRYDVISIWEQLRDVFKAVLEDAEASGELVMPPGGAGLVANNFIGSLTVHLQLGTVDRRLLTRRLARHITSAIVVGLMPRTGGR
ncbi:MAG: TetR/AcrR family transcriptional regulator [Deltaproteobacteria bacterium]|nr:TetR/AcrR family transcriptional regulator [Deltaproteobacteria bacterium]